MEAHKNTKTEISVHLFLLPVALIAPHNGRSMLIDFLVRSLSNPAQLTEQAEASVEKFEYLIKKSML